MQRLPILEILKCYKLTGESPKSFKHVEEWQSRSHYLDEKAHLPLTVRVSAAAAKQLPFIPFNSAKVLRLARPKSLGSFWKLQSC